MQGEEISPTQDREDMLRAVIVTAAKAMKQKRTKENPDGVMENLLEENASPSKEGENQTVEKTVKDLSPKIVLKRLDAEKNIVENDEQDKTFVEETEPVKSTNENGNSEKEAPNSSEPKDIHENVDDMDQESIVLDEHTGESK